MSTRMGRLAIGDDWVESLVGNRIGRGWRLVRVLGAGGSATVYEAISESGQLGAAKIMHARLVGEREWHVRFAREVEMLSSLPHAGLPRLYESGEIDGAPFLVMELLRGSSLERWVRRDPAERLPVDVVQRVGIAVLEVLEQMHARGIVHRDLKPSNLFLTEDGTVRVLDLGIARRDPTSSQASSLTRGLLGTPAFMPPEQARGRWELVDARSDLWALGAVLFSLLTGEHVHAAETTNEQLGLAMASSGRLLSSVAPHVGRGLAVVVDRSLAYRREDRWQTAAQFRVALERAEVWSHDEPVAAAGDSTWRGLDDGEPLSLPSTQLPSAAGEVEPLSPPAAPRTSEHTSRPGRRFWLAGALLGVVSAPLVFVAAVGRWPSAIPSSRTWPEPLQSSAVVAQPHPSAVDLDGGQSLALVPSTEPATTTREAQPSARGLTPTAVSVVRGGTRAPSTATPARAPSVAAPTRAPSVATPVRVDPLDKRR